MSTNFSESRLAARGKIVPAGDKKRNRSKGSGKNYLSSPVYNIKELASLYEVQVNLPGLKREKLTIDGNEHLLSIDALEGAYAGNTKKIHQDIAMPENADTALTIAEYKNDTLYLFVPKVTLPLPHCNTKIVVY